MKMLSDRILIIGLDGATWDVLVPWIQDGTLPHLKRLKEKGVWGDLASTLPPLTAPAWATFMTGKNPGKHGVFHFIVRHQDAEASTGRPAVVNARSIKTPTLWDILSHHGRRVGLVNVPMTYPSRPVNGFMITGLLTPPNAPVFTYPPELAEQLSDYKIDLDRFIHHKPFTGDESAPHFIEPSLDLIEEYCDLLERRCRNTLTLMESQPWDVFMVVVAGTDRMGHYLWPYHRFTDLDDLFSHELHRAVRDYYIRVDQAIGVWMEAAGADTTVILMSDHGMGPIHHKYVQLNQWLREQGLLVLKSEGANLNRPDFWLSRLGIPRDKLGWLVRAIPGLATSRIVQKAQYAETAALDMEQTIAYYAPIYVGTGGIRINVKGDGRSIFASDVEREALRERLLEHLRQLTDPETGQPLVLKAYRGEEYYYGPYATDVPDILLLLDAPYSGSDRLSHYSSIVTPRTDRINLGDHRLHGIFLASGPAILPKVGPVRDLSLQDIAPTVLYLLGLPVPADMDGRVLTEVIHPNLLTANPVTMGDPLDFWGVRLEETETENAFAAEDEEAIRDRLAALGYLD
jgi:predicted AlkP superfamily phosphohydrolase/phosphomutase